MIGRLLPWRKRAQLLALGLSGLLLSACGDPHAEHANCGFFGVAGHDVAPANHLSLILDRYELRILVLDVLPDEGGDTAFDREEFHDPQPDADDRPARPVISILDSRPKDSACG